MPLRLSAAELEQLARGIQLLASPLDHPSVDAWRSAVNRHLLPLLRADSAGFLLPVSEGLALYSDEHDPVELARYPDYPPPPLIDGSSLWELAIRAGVSTLRELYGGEYGRYVNSAYNQEYAGANGAHDPLMAAHSLGGTDARGMACMHFWHERPTGQRFGEREVAILRLLHPAFRAGVETLVRWGRHREALVGMLDAVGQPVIVFDASGRRVHQTPQFTELVAADPEASAVRARVDAAMTALRGALVPRIYRGDGAPGSVAGEAETAHARYAIRATFYGGEPRGSDTLILVAVERLTPVPRPDIELKERFGLTRAEIRVARLIARGRSNREIADELFISPHTARRHTERVLQKLNVASRAGVAGRVLV